MLARPLCRRHVALVIAAAFLAGAGATKVALRTRAAIERVRHEREVGAAGQLVQLELQAPDGEVLARPRVIAPAGKTTRVVLHDPERPDEVRLALRLEAVREPSGLIALAYALWVPGRAITARGTLSLKPGVQQAMALGDGTIVASFLAVPVPSAAFDAYLEVEAARRTAASAS